MAFPLVKSLPQRDGFTATWKLYTRKRHGALMVLFSGSHREHLDHETLLSRSANRLLMKQFLTRFVGRLACYLHNNEDLESITKLTI